MKKILLQLIVMVGAFVGAWYALSRIDWMHLFRVKQATQKTEEKLGNLIWDVISKTEKQAVSVKIVLPLDTMVGRICSENNISREEIKLHVIVKDETNAFALPNNHLVVYTGLINDCKNEAEVCGVLGHEIAHMQKNHVMKKLAKEIGLSALISMTTGGKSPEMVKQLVKLLSSRAYDRSLESEADMAAVEYLLNADIPPGPFADFLYRLSKADGAMPQELVWISTHPDSEERAEKIIDYLKDKKINSRPVIAAETWDILKERIGEEQ